MKNEGKYEQEQIIEKEGVRGNEKEEERSEEEAGRSLFEIEERRRNYPETPCEIFIPSGRKGD